MALALIRHLPIEPKFDFMSRSKAFLAFSTLLVLLSVGLFLGVGLNFGVDFRGGIMLDVLTKGPADLSSIRGRLGNLGLGDITVQTFGADDNILINVERQAGDAAEQAEAVATIKEALADTAADYNRVDFVGPKVGGELKRAGVLATVLALLGIATYIWFRFEWQFGLAALVALIHDVVATIGFYAVTQIEFNLATLAAVLTIAGYSINDTVVIFDRVRETLRKYKKLDINAVLNMAINRTLTRTLLTSVTTLLALGALFLFGGQVIRGFTSGLIWGVMIGTYSSIGLAVPLLARTNMRASMAATDEQKP